MSEGTERGRWANTQVHAWTPGQCEDYGNHQGSTGHEPGEGVKGWGQGQPWCGQEGTCGPSLRRPSCQQGRTGKGPGLREVWLDVRLLGGGVGRCRLLAGHWSPGSWYFA